MRPIALILCLLLAAVASCQQEKKKKEPPTLPPGYDTRSLVKIKLTEDLDEISGIRYDPSGTRIIAENDEEGRLFELDPGTGKVSASTRFNSGGDFEDLTFDGRYWYVLRSNGNIFRISHAFTDSVTTEVFKLHLPGFNNFESLFYNPVDKKAYLFCKQCEADSGRRISIYAFNTVTAAYDSGPVFTMIPDRAMIGGMDSTEIIKPSAAAIHPITGEWYILASVNHLLIVTDPAWTWKKVYALNKDWFKQPEGISFAPNGDLYISNEARSGTANIVHIPWTGK
jgi:DNA-binding beta-propeller fold protein YncE